MEERRETGNGSKGTEGVTKKGYYVSDRLIKGTMGE